MLNRPTVGGRFRRNPETGEVTPDAVDSDGTMIFVPADPEPEPDTAPAETRPARSRKRT